MRMHLYLPVLCSCLTCVYVYHFMYFQKMAAGGGPGWVYNFIYMCKLYSRLHADGSGCAVCMHALIVQ